MTDAVLPKIGHVHATPMGVRMWRPSFTELQVCHANDGHTVLTVSGALDGQAIFDLDANTARALALLIWPELVTGEFPGPVQPTPFKEQVRAAV